MATTLKCVVLGLTLGLGAAAVVAIPNPACAAELDKKSKADAKEATAFYKEGNYDDAARIFLRLSVANPDTLVFVRNLGACYYYLRRAEPALSNLRDYLHRKKNIADDDRAEVERWIGEMDRLHTEPAQPLPAQPLPPSPVVPVVPVAPVAPVESAPLAPAYPVPTQPMFPAPGYPSPSGSSFPVGVAAQPAPAASNGYRTTAWILGITGVAGIGVGGVFTALALDNFSTTEKKYNPAAEKDGKAFAKYQFIAYGAGAALLVTGIILGTHSPGSPSVALVPTENGDGMAGVVHGRF